MDQPRTRSAAKSRSPRGLFLMRSPSNAKAFRRDLAPLDLGDLVGLGAAGGHDFHGSALLLADQRSRQRRGDGDAALLGIGLRLADDLPHRFLVGVFVDQRDGRAELDGGTGKLADVDDIRSEMRPFLASASGSPTICHTAFLSVSSSTSVTVAPNLMVSPESLLMSMISARASLSSNSAIRPSLWDCSSLAA